MTIIYNSKPSYFSMNILLFLILFRFKKYFASSIDIGCGKGRFLPLLNFLTKDQKIYACDIDKLRVSQCKKKFPYVTFFNCSFNELNDKYDFVFCNQTFTNRYFRTKSKDFNLDSIRKLIDITHDGGVLCFNVAKSQQQYLNEIEILLKSNFKSMKLIHYGGFDKPKPFLINIFFFSWISLIIKSNYNTYFICLNKFGEVT